MSMTDQIKSGPSAVHLTVRGEFVEPPATHPEPFYKLRESENLS